MSDRAIVVELDEQAADAFSDALLEAGALSASVEDADAGTADEHAIFGEPGSATQQHWRRNVVRALVPEDADIDALLAAASEAAGLTGVPAHRVEEVPDRDWVRATQSQFQPIRISGRLWIVPSWHAAPDPAAINIVLDPGLAFGTGSHPTTRLCLQWLEANVHPGCSVLDYGCGSGILGIAARRLGAGEVTGVDIDPAALTAARDNARANGATIRLAGTGDLGALQADLVAANILATPLKVLAPLLAGHTHAGGRIVLAGLLEEQAESVSAVYRPWFDMRVYAVAEGWAALEGTKR